MRESLYFLSGETPSGQYARVDQAVPGRFHVGKPKARSPLPDCLNSDDLDLIVSPRFAQALSVSGATGYRIEPVELLRADEGLDGYGKLIVTGQSPRAWPGFHDDHVREQRYVDDGPWVAEHACLDPAPDGWDGSDLFTPAGTSFIILTQRAKDAIDEAGLTAITTQVGRTTFPLFHEDETTEDAWRQRVGAKPGDRPGEPVCPELLDQK